MNEQSPYDNAFLKKLQDLPVPNEDVSWAAMESMLDKKDDERPVPPPFFKNCGCMGALLLLLILMVGGFFIIDPVNLFHSNKQKDDIDNNSSTTKTTSALNPTGNIDTAEKGPENNGITNIKVKTGASIKDQNDYTDTLSLSNHINTFSLKVKGAVTRESAKVYNQNKTKQTTDPVSITKNNYRKHNLISTKTPAKTSSKITNDISEESVQKDTSTQPIFTENQLKEKGDSTSFVAKKAMPLADTSRKKEADAVVSKTDSTKTPANKNKFYVGAGLGMFQLIPIAGQKSNPYNASGRKNSLGDYIPAVYVRLYKEKKWFIQGEFRYGAPQYTRDILYFQKGILDSAGTLTVTNSRIKKTFYHQLPISFNYLVVPGFSLGAGFTFNKFTSAVVQQEVHRTNVASQLDTLINSATFNQKKADSNFVNTYLQAQFEMQYNWKKFSAGARYSFGLQPYLKFQLPGGAQSKESNHSLQLFLRYELWNNKKK
ncbi:hypothetical protein BH11BAC3_BH11BAC3_46800 [soil metagenome]